MGASGQTYVGFPPQSTNDVSSCPLLYHIEHGNASADKYTVPDVKGDDVSSQTGREVLLTV